jgi:hypothetical protein
MLAEYAARVNDHRTKRQGQLTVLVDVTCASRSGTSRMRALPLTFLVFPLALVSACDHGEPPSPKGPLNVYAIPDSRPSARGVDAAAAPTLATRLPSASAVDAGSQAGPNEPEAPAPAPTATDAALPQTKVKPSATSKALEARARALFTAIVRDEPQLALPFFFPKEAYEQVKAIPNPAADWKRRLVSAFERDIHAAHLKVEATDGFVALEVPDARARWVEENEEANRIGYYRVFGSKLTYTHGPEQRSIPLTSLISWRGEWYIVHFNGFK